MLHVLLFITYHRFVIHWCILIRHVPCWLLYTHFLPDHQATLLTRCSVYWTLQRVSSLARTSSTTACHTCCMRNCTGSTSQSVSTTDWESQCTLSAVQGHRVPGRLLYTSLRLSPAADIIYVQSLDITWQYHVTGSSLSVVGPSLSLVRRFGTRYRTVSVTQRSPATVSHNRWRRICFVVYTQRSRDASWLCAI